MRYFGCKLTLLVAIVMCGAATAAIAQSPCLLAEAQSPVYESLAMWAIRCVGLVGLLPGAAVFVGACFVVFLARRPAVIASYLPFLFLPLLLATIGALKGNVTSFSILARSDEEIRQSQIFQGLAETLLLPLVALVVTLPSYFVIAIGLFVRTLCTDSQPTPHGREAKPPLGVAVSGKAPNQP